MAEVHVRNVQDSQLQADFMQLGQQVLSDGAADVVAGSSDELRVEQVRVDCLCRDQSQGWLGSPG